MTKQFTITVDDFIGNMIESTAGNNKSQRVQELIMRGYMQESQEKYLQEIAALKAAPQTFSTKKALAVQRLKNALCRILSRNSGKFATFRWLSN